MKLTFTRADIIELVRNFVIDLDPKKRQASIEVEQAVGEEWIEAGSIRVVVHFTDEEAPKEKENAKAK